MASNGYTTTTFSIFPDLLPPPKPEFSIPVPTNTELTGTEMWMRFQRSFSQSQRISTVVDRAETLRVRRRAARARARASSSSTRQRRVPVRPRPARFSIDLEAELQTTSEGPIVPPETLSVQPSGPGTGTGTCPICMSPFDEPTTTKCGHIFCKMCITDALESVKKCPICRKRLTKRDTMIRVYLP